MVKLDQLVQSCKDSFWARKTYEDGGHSHPLTLYVACWNVVHRDVKSMVMAISLLSQLGQRNFPLPHTMEASNQRGWLNLLQQMIGESIANHLDKDATLLAEEKRRDARR